MMNGPALSTPRSHAPCDRDMTRVKENRQENTDPGNPPAPLRKSGLVEVLRSCNQGNIRVVVLNACHTSTLAGALREVIDCVVCMDQQISDCAAIMFSASFYGCAGVRSLGSECV